MNRFSHDEAYQTMSPIMRKLVLVFGFFLALPRPSNTNLAVRLQKMARDLKCQIYVQLQMARGLKFLIYVEAVLYYLCSENKGAAQLICTFVLAYAKVRICNDSALMIKIYCKISLAKLAREC